MSDAGRSDGNGRQRVDVSGCAERPIVFACNGLRLVGIVAVPAQPIRRGVVIVVGGPQYRAGSHRQFTLLCRHLAEQGVASLRFDYHGLGDSEGPPALGVDGLADDLRCAIDALMSEVPELDEVVLWGLCGAASAAALYLPDDARVVGVVMLNPNVGGEDATAAAQLRFYYLDRFLNPAFWRRLLRGEVQVFASLRDLWQSVRKAAGARPVAPQRADAMVDDAPPTRPLGERVLDALGRAPGVRLLLILSGNDLTAQAFLQLASSSRAWRRLMASRRLTYHHLAEANHTFATAEWRRQVEQWTVDWVKGR